MDEREIATIAREIQRIVRCDGYTGLVPEADAIARVLKKILIRKDLDVISRIEEMAVESIPPDEFETFCTILKLMKETRKSLHCPWCESPLEDNGKCSDVGNNNCMYQA